MKALVALFASCMILGLTAGCATRGADRDDRQLSVGDMQAIRRLINTDSAIPAHWKVSHAAYHMMVSLGIAKSERVTFSRLRA
jgi:hypothetical protein